MPGRTDRDDVNGKVDRLQIASGQEAFSPGSWIGLTVTVCLGRQLEKQSEILGMFTQEQVLLHSVGFTPG